MRQRLAPWFVTLIAASICWHALTLLDHQRQAWREQQGRDFASYYFAVQVALDGGDPYDKGALAGWARDDGSRKSVHPFFYPPPYLLTMLWVSELSLVDGYRVWFWLDELFALATLLLLWRWWRPLGPAVGVTLVATLATLTALPNNHLMGQMNLPVLFLTLLALQQEEDGHPVRGGIAAGIACMMKMSPALFVAWWLLRRRYRAVVVSVITAVVLTLVSLPLVGPEIQWRFYTDVLPGFGSGRYNGLGVGIDLFGNHSLPNLFDEAFPAGGGHLVLSDTARWLSTGTLLALVGFTGWSFRRQPSDGLARAAQVGAVGAAMLLVPVITYEHHLVWLWPAAAATMAALVRGRLSRRWAVPVGLALMAWCYDLALLKDAWSWLRDGAPGVAYVIREAKMMAILVLYAACVVVGSAPATTGPSPQEAGT